uniref:cyclin-dependent kinase n=1 Tax=Timema poppense TaxID=170557 RepID=A0A7R9CWS5_TIMPO|nr:unnamed protein product [Timema poppensis]
MPRFDPGTLSSVDPQATDLAKGLDKSYDIPPIVMSVKGAYGTVYKAKDLSNNGMIVALKKVRVPLTDDGVPMSTLREISLLKQLDTYDHPNIVRLPMTRRSGFEFRLGVLRVVFTKVFSTLDANAGTLKRTNCSTNIYIIQLGVD